MSPAPRGPRRVRLPPAAPTEQLDALRTEFEELQLGGPEARVLAALVYSGSGTAATLARLAKVTQPNVYPVLERLTARRLAERVPGAVATWVAPSGEETLARLCALQEERLDYVRHRAARAREVMAAVLPREPSAPLAYVHLLADPTHTRAVYDQLVRDAREEVLMFSRPPYLWTPGSANPVNVEAVARLSGRCLYEEVSLYAPDAARYRRETETYIDAGLQVRVGGELPIKLAIFDRRTALVGMADPQATQYPMLMHVENEGYAIAMAACFEHYWNAAKGYRRLPAVVETPSD